MLRLHELHERPRNFRTHYYYGHILYIRPACR